MAICRPARRLLRSLLCNAQLQEFGIALLIYPGRLTAAANRGMPDAMAISGRRPISTPTPAPILLLADALLTLKFAR
jgi:hypothetical protein